MSSHDGTDRPRSQVVFLGSSTEGKKVARAIEAGLHNYSDLVTVDAWYHFGTWSLGSGTLESLESRLRACDFAILLLSADDLTISRNEIVQPAPRDNVLFELGLFMGRLGRERAFFCFPADQPGFKLPSDLFGITAIPFKNAEANEISVICTAIMKQIDMVARKRINAGTHQRPQLLMNVRLPHKNSYVTSKTNGLSGAVISTLKLQIRVDDKEIDDFRIYFDDRLNLYKSSWSYRLDAGRLFYDATRVQIAKMKSDWCMMSFEVAYPRVGHHSVEAVALHKGEWAHSKQLEIRVD